MFPGQLITPNLRLRALLGKGGMGSVWSADHLALGTQVAVKFMSTAYVENASLVQRFRTEAMAAAQIKSPHVAQVFDHGIMEDSTPYIVMELLEGEDLKQRIRREGQLPLKDIAHILAQAAKALSRAHALGIVHRDIKPDNIFLCHIDGETFCKVLDFGIAKMGSDGSLGATTTGSMMGTPLYMSPEQLLSAKRVDHRSDLWSLAVVAYHAVTGRVPFHGETVGSLSVAVHAGVFVPPSGLRADISPQLDAWFLKALQRDPNARFGTAKELADSFAEAIQPSNAMAYGRPMMASHAQAFTAAPTSHEAAGLAHAPGTLMGAATTHATSAPNKKGGALVALAVAAVVALGGLLFVFARGSSDVSNPVTSTAQAAQAPAPPTTEPPIVAPASTESAAAAAPPPASAETQKPASAPPPSKASQTAQEGSTTKASTSKATPAPSPAGPRKPPSGAHDTIGF